MTEFEKNVNELKNGLKSMLKTDASEAEINKISELDKYVDVLVAENQKTAETNTKLKERLIEYVSTTGFKTTSDKSDEITGQEQPKTIEECIEEVIKARPAKNN